MTKPEVEEEFAKRRVRDGKDALFTLNPFVKGSDPATEITWTCALCHKNNLLGNGMDLHARVAHNMSEYRVDSRLREVEPEPDPDDRFQIGTRVRIVAEGTIYHVHGASRRADVQWDGAHSDNSMDLDLLTVVEDDD